MKLIGSFTSPYVRKIRVVLAEKKIEAEFVLDSPWVEGNSVAKFNPLGKVPVLVLDDDSTLFDSRVIAEYLDSMTPNNKLFPAAGRERIGVKRWEALADGICDAASAAFLEGKRPRKTQDANWIERQRGKVTLGLEALAGDLGENAWCFGNSMSLADVAVGCALGYLAFRFPDIAWHDQYPNLARLYAKLLARPSFADTIPHD